MLNKGIFFLELNPYQGLYPDSEKENSSSCIRVLHKHMREFHAVHYSYVVDVKEISIKKRDALAELLFSFKNQLFFSSRRSRCRCRCRGYLSSFFFWSVISCDPVIHCFP